MIIFNKSIQHIHITSGQIQSFAAVVPVQQTCTSFIGFILFFFSLRTVGKQQSFHHRLSST